MSFRPAALPPKREISLYNILSFFRGFIPIYPVYMILFADQGFTYTDISALIAIWALPALLLEVPSGLLADRWSRKGVIALGMLLKSLCFLVWALPLSFASAASGFLLWGTEGALCSGSLEAHLYDILRREGKESAYERTAGRAVALETLSTALAMASGGALYAANPILALSISSAACLVSAALALALSETACKAESPGKVISFLSEFREGIREFAGKGRILRLVLVSCLASMAYGLVDEYDGLLAREWMDLAPGLVGLWGAARIGVQALGSWLCPRISGVFRLDRDSRFALYLLAAGLLFAVSAFLPPFAAFIPYFGYYFLLSAAEILLGRRLQEEIEKAGRATVLSMRSFAMTISGMAAAPLFGIASDRHGIRVVIVLAGALTALSAAFLRARKGKIRLPISGR